jgi:hypothetical protein
LLHSKNHSVDLVESELQGSDFNPRFLRGVTILSTSDIYLILGAVTVFLMVVVMTLPVRAMPPRIHFARL